PIHRVIERPDRHEIYSFLQRHGREPIRIPLGGLGENTRVNLLIGANNELHPRLLQPGGVRQRIERDSLHRDTIRANGDTANGTDNLYDWNYGVRLTVQLEAHLDQSLIARRYTRNRDLVADIRFRGEFHPRLLAGANVVHFGHRLQITQAI